MVNNVMFSSNSCEWPTPQGLFDVLNSEFGFTLDPCATKENTKCSKYFTKLQDGLQQGWTGESVFMNPPYGREIIKWMKKAYETSMQETYPVVCLVPSRTDTRWWHDYCMKANEIRFIKGRIKFGGYEHPACFPSAIVVFNSAHDRIRPNDYPKCVTWKPNKNILQ